MTDEDVPPSFRAWFPRIEHTRGGLVCSWYLSQTGPVGIGEGTAGISARLLAAAGITGEVREWKVERICTPFFTGDPDAADWVDRYPLSWRWTVHADGGSAGGSPEREGAPVTLGDPTWRTTPEFWVPGDEKCEVIGVTRDVSGFAERVRECFPDRETEAWDLPTRDHALTVTRVRLGHFEVQANIDLIDSARATLNALGAATYIDAYLRLTAMLPENRGHRA